MFNFCEQNRRMNPSLTHLLTLANKPRTIVGLMSGTSLDGLDIALCKISGEGNTTSLAVNKFKSLPYNKEFLAVVRPLFANKNASLHEVTLANAYVARAHAKMLLDTLATWDIKTSEIDVLASHGQTIYHAPHSAIDPTNKQQKVVSSTLQIGDGDHLAYLSQILTLSDFRQKHVAANGEGAPLIPYADFLLFSDSNEHRVLLNIGGIANYTFLPANGGFNAVVSADTGPGNTLMDTAILHVQSLSLQKPLNTLPISQYTYDKNGEFAQKGNVNEHLLLTLISLSKIGSSQLNIPQENLPSKRVHNKSTGQETYNIHFIMRALAQAGIPNFPTQAQDFYDLLATLNMFTAKTISNAINALPLPNGDNALKVVYVSGGGVHNQVLLRNIAQCLPTCKVCNSAQLGIAPDAKEAALFAVLANQTLFGHSSVFRNNNGVPATTFGKISLP